MIQGEASKSPGRMARAMLVALTAGYCYLDYFGYRNAGFGPAGVWDNLLAGRANAPEQYRMGVVWLAHALELHLHLKLPAVLAALDALCGLVALLLLLAVLKNTAVYAHANRTSQWMGAAVFLLLAQWFLPWALWLQKPETLPSALLIAAMTSLWQSDPPRERKAPTAAALILLSALLAFVRADVSCLFNAGVLLAILLRRGDGFSLRRGWALAASGSGILAALAVQAWMMREMYPQANYGNVKMWQLRPNLVHASRWPPFVVFLLPLAWMAWQVKRRRFSGDAVGLAALLGGALYLALWITIGKIDEVRIFLPFAFALLPLTAEMVMLRAGGD